MAIKKKKALLIDDDPDFCFLVKTILEAKGMEVVSYLTIAEASVFLETEIPDVILLDMELKDEYGIDFLKQRYVHLKWSKIPVIVCSSQAEALVVKAAIHYGADDYLLKPIKQTWLIQRVRKLLMKVDLTSYKLPLEEDIELIIEAKSLSASVSNFIARSSIGFDKDVMMSVSIPQFDDEGIVVGRFKSAEKSRFNSQGPFDTLLSFLPTSESEKKRIMNLKNFWIEKND